MVFCLQTSALADTSDTALMLVGLPVLLVPLDVPVQFAHFELSSARAHARLSIEVSVRGARLERSSEQARVLSERLPQRQFIERQYLTAYQFAHSDSNVHSLSGSTHLLA